MKFLINLVCGLIPVKSIRHNLRNKLRGKSCPEEVITLKAKGKKQGNCLVSYLKDAALLTNKDKMIRFHSNVWECREICRIFVHLGYDVDVINWNTTPPLKKKYDIIFDICQNLHVYSALNPESLKFLHITTSYPAYQNKEARKRNLDFNARHNCNYTYLRECDEINFEKSITVATYCTLIGNNHTKNTFPQKYRNKIHCVNVTASQFKYSKKEKEYTIGKEFLFFSGSGAVHKGLDLVLDAFIKHSDWILNVVGPLDEKDLWNQYNLEQHSNIVFHRYCSPSSEKFQSIIKKCFVYIGASCSEGQSSAAITAISAGLLPILSADMGITFSKYDFILKDVQADSIEKAICKVLSFSDKKIVSYIKKIQSEIKHRNSRKNFSKAMRHNIVKAIYERKSED